MPFHGFTKPWGSKVLLMFFFIVNSMVTKKKYGVEFQGFYHVYNFNTLEFSMKRINVWQFIELLRGYWRGIKTCYNLGIWLRRDSSGKQNKAQKARYDYSICFLKGLIKRKMTCRLKNCRKFHLRKERRNKDKHS